MRGSFLLSCCPLLSYSLFFSCHCHCHVMSCSVLSRSRPVLSFCPLSVSFVLSFSWLCLLFCLLLALSCHVMFCFVSSCLALCRLSVSFVFSWLCLLVCCVVFSSPVIVIVMSCSVLCLSCLLLFKHFPLMPCLVCCQN